MSKNYIQLTYFSSDFVNQIMSYQIMQEDLENQEKGEDEDEI
jgi:hypothetical protein